MSFESAMLNQESNGTRYLMYGIMAAIAVLTVVHFFSLYTTPIPDSYLWWGDESWLLLEFRNQITHGIFRHPYAFYSSINHSSGALLGSMWLSALFYGLPAALFSNHANLIDIGRTVTALLSMFLLWSIYRFARKLGISPVGALLATLFVESTRSFFFTSHSARYDILTSLGIVWLLYLAFYLLQQHEGRPSRRLFLLGAAAGTSFMVSIHVVLLTFPVIAIYLVLDKSMRTWRFFLQFAAGFILVALLLGFIQYVLDPHVFASHAESAFAWNLNEIPILRPFSRSVQWANLQQKGLFFYRYAWPLLILAVLAFVSLTLGRRRMSNVRILCLLFTPFIIYFLVESSAPSSYLIYCLPTLTLGVFYFLQELKVGEIGLLKGKGSQRLIPFAVVILAVGAFVGAMLDSVAASETGANLQINNEHVINAAMNQLRSENRNKPLVLAFNPALTYLIGDTSIQLMTTHFVEFSAARMTTEDVIRSAHVEYVLLYHSSLRWDYMREVRPLIAASETLGSVIFKTTGCFLDVGRSYDGSRECSAPDTLELIRINP